MRFSQRKMVTRFNVSSIVLLFASWLVGCSESSKKAAAPPVAIPLKDVEPKGPPQTADVAVRRVLDGLRQHNVRAVWEFLPPSHRAEIQQIVRDVAKHLDDKSWEATVAVWQKARKVIPPRSKAIFGVGASEEAFAKTASPAISSDSLQRLFDSIGNSELADLKRLRQIDVGQFLEQTGGEVLQALGALPTGGVMPAQAFENLAKVEVTLVTATADSAIVSIKWPNQEPTEHAYVRMDGYWFPKGLAEGWSDSLADVRSQAIAWAEAQKQQPDAWNIRLKAIEQLLDEIASTKSDEDARAVYQQGMQRLVGTWLGTPTVAPEKTPSVPTVKKLKVPDTEEVLPDEK